MDRSITRMGQRERTVGRRSGSRRRRRVARRWVRSCERMEIARALEGQTGMKIGIGRDRVTPQFGRPDD